MYLYKNQNNEIRVVVESSSVSRNELVERVQKAERRLAIAKKALEDYDKLSTPEPAVVAPEVTQPAVQDPAPVQEQPTTPDVAQPAGETTAEAAPVPTPPQPTDLTIQ